MIRTAAASLAILLGLSVARADDAPLPAAFDKIKTIVIVYAENRSFVHLLPDYPGAFGIADAAKDSIVQRDRDGSVLPSLPPVWTEGSNPPAADPAYPDTMPNAPFDIVAPPYDLPSDVLTVTPVHRFYQSRMQINGGRNDMFVAWTDVGSLVMGHYPAQGTRLQKLAAEFTLADHFFMGAYGGSNLNHFWLVCACSPHWEDAPERDRSVLDEAGNLKLAPDSPGSALNGPPLFINDGNYSPDGYVVNTVQPAYQPSAVPPPLGGDQRLTDPGYHPLPPQTGETIGSLLSAKGIDWTWYAEGWDVALADRGVIYNTRGAVNFQPHHQPFNYYAAYAPGTTAREEHLKDMKQFWVDAEAGTLPAVVFLKPDGTSNQHPGESTMAAGDLMMGSIVSTLRRSPQWGQMAVIINHDENGGFWDPVTPPIGDRWGPGSRVPTVIASPFARKGFVDHTPYDTTSILQFISKRFDLAMLPGIRTSLGDLRKAFTFGD